MWANRPTARCKTPAAAKGLDLSRLRARQVTRADFDRFDLILAMDAENLSDLRALDPRGPAKLRLFLDPLEGGGRARPVLHSRF